MLRGEGEGEVADAGRLDVSGKTASLIVPVYIPPGADGENILGTAYEPVWAIACSLASHDHRILERLPDKANRLPKETSDVIARCWHFDFTVHPERIAQAMDLVSFDSRDPAFSRSRRLGLAAGRSYRDHAATSTSRPTMWTPPATGSAPSSPPCATPRRPDASKPTGSPNSTRSA
ncbi:hypothetical protein [Streptomyces griseoluteus]|uniref:hypothetical protein n=1 Tax=Streptomyces griseoluteus TaxID=29306 RepID=UPI001FCC8174|nr:hypothetical protein [Streptomyces griseoluteus]